MEKLDIRNYKPDFFTPENLDHAKNIILTPEDSTIENRWEIESNWTLEVIRQFCQINEDSVVLDWGCGIGRMSKLLIDNFGCKVVGIDIDAKMIEYSHDYVNSDRFSVVPYDDLFKNMPRNHFTHALGIWVFQHSNKLYVEIPLIYESLQNKGQLFVIDMLKKCIPSETGFYTDNIDTRPILEKFFEPLLLGKLPLSCTTQKIQDMSWFGLLQKVKK